MMASTAFAQQQARTRVWTDATRLGALLHDVQVDVRLSENVWRTVVNEANMLANRVYANTGRNAQARSSARELREHVRAMRQAGLRGSAADARRHAAEAMPSLHRVIEWAAPAR